MNYIGIHVSQTCESSVDSEPKLAVKLGAVGWSPRGSLRATHTSGLAFRAYTYEPLSPFFVLTCVLFQEWLKVSILQRNRDHWVIFYTNAAPTGDDTLRPNDAGKIAVELLEAQNESFNFGLMLALPLHEVEAICEKISDPRDRLLHIIIAFLRQAEPRPTWRVIVDALRSPLVNLTALARRVEAAHFPDLTATRDSVPQTTGKSLSVPLTCVSHIFSFQTLSQPLLLQQQL